MSNAKRESEGRYTRITRGVIPGELPPIGKRGSNIQIVHAVVDDPNAAVLSKQRVAVNAKTDVLEQEYAYRRIDDGAYAAGITYQAALERAQVRGLGSQWAQGGRSDPAERKDSGIVFAIDAAKDAVSMIDDARQVVGMRGEKILRLALIDRFNFSDIARAVSGSAAKGSIDKYAWAFRQALADLSDHWAAKRR